MDKKIYLNFNDLCEETKEDILRKAEEDIRNDESEMADIIDMYGEDCADEIVSERAERKLYEYDFIFNV